MRGLVEFGETRGRGSGGMVVLGLGWKGGWVGLGNEIGRGKRMRKVLRRVMDTHARRNAGGARAAKTRVERVVMKCPAQSSRCMLG